MAEALVAELTVKRHIHRALLQHYLVDNVLETAVGGLGVGIANNLREVTGVGADKFGNTYYLGALFFGRCVPAVHVPLVEVLQNDVKLCSVFLGTSGVYHSRGERIDDGLLGVEHYLLVESRAAQAVGVEVGLVEQVLDINAAVLGHAELRYEVAQIPIHLLPSRSVEGHNGGDSGIYFHELLALHLEVGLAVFGPFYLFVVAVLCRIEQRCKSGLIRAVQIQVVELLDFFIGEHTEVEQRVAQLAEHVGVGGLFECCRGVERVERLLDALDGVEKIMHEHVLAALAQVGRVAVEA